MGQSVAAPTHSLLGGPQFAPVGVRRFASNRPSSTEITITVLTGDFVLPPGLEDGVESVLEKPLRGLVQERAPDWEREVSIDQDAIDAIEDRHREAREAILESAEIRYAQFPTLEFCLRELGVDRS